MVRLSQQQLSLANGHLIQIDMNHTPTAHWSPMVTAPEDDFSGFIDFETLSFPTFDATPIPDAALHQHHDAGGTMDTTMEGTGSMLALEHESMQQIEHLNQIPTMNNYPPTTEPFPDMNMSPSLMHQAQQIPLHMQHQRYHGQNAVPPTPTSIEMHGGHPQYYQPTPEQQHQQQMYEHYKRQQKINFTPLVSPAVTPLDTQFQYNDYTTPQDCFSPLTSPALRAQNQNGQHSVYGAARGSDTSNATSPIDPTLDYAAPTSGSTSGSLRKSKRKTSSSSMKNPSRAVRQSPAMKPQSKKKHPSSTVIPPKEVAGIIEEARKSKRPYQSRTTSDGKLPLPYNQDSSGADSLSPEPLSDLMPPPATPRSNSAGRSPYLNAKQGGPQNAATQDKKEEPATPASLMKIRKGAGKAGGPQLQSSNLKEQAMLAEADMEQIMEDIVLPESVSTTKKPVLSPINTSNANKDQASPIAAARKLHNNGAASAPITATGSAFPSPLLSGIASPGGVAGKRGDQRLKVKDRKKGNSNNSVQASPALRPRISPAIKPLLPEGAVVSAETSALLLAAKSNYQNLIEGNHLPGVSYPENLSTNLTSKRTSHKIAEQGRRNRINTALQEIASLLPLQTGSTMNSGDGGVNGSPASNIMMGTAAQQSNSKASTVELAIEYIKGLQREIRETKEKLASVEKGRGLVGNEAKVDAGISIESTTTSA